MLGLRPFLREEEGMRMIDSIRVESDELWLGLIEREVRGMGLCATFAEPGG